MRARGTRPLAIAIVLLLGALIGGVSVVGSAAPARADTATTTISGVISLPPSAPLAWLKAVQVLAEPASGTDTFGTVNLQNGNYTISGLAPGTYQIYFRSFVYTDPSTGLTVKPNLVNEYYGGTGYLATATPVSTSVSAPAIGVDVTMQLGATITGTLLGVPFPDAEIHLVDLADPSHELVWGADTDTAGHYTITGVRPGSYKILFGTLAPSELPTPCAYLGGTSYATATTITVAEGATVTIPGTTLPAAETNPPALPAPSVSLASTTATAVSLAWTPPASADPILAYSVGVASGPHPYSEIFAATSTTGQATMNTWATSPSASTLAWVLATTEQAESPVAPIVINEPSDAAAPTVSAVDVSSGVMTVTASVPSDAGRWSVYLPAGGTIGELQTQNGGTTFQGLDRSVSGTVYAGWYTDDAQSQIATLTLPPAVDQWFQAKWQQLGGASGALGSPTAGMQCQSSSCWQQFAGGVLTSDGHEIVKLSSAYVSTWLAWGGPNGDLGLVAGPEACYGTYCETSFAGGVLVWVPNSGVFPVATKWFAPAWTARGGASGSLGLPAAAMQCQSVACYQVFQHGTLTSSTSGIVALSSEYVTTWLSSGGPGGALGLVSGPETCNGTSCEVPFQHGNLIWQPGVGVHTAP